MGFILLKSVSDWSSLPSYFLFFYLFYFSSTTVRKTWLLDFSNFLENSNRIFIFKIFIFQGSHPCHEIISFLSDLPIHRIELLIESCAPKKIPQGVKTKTKNHLITQDLISLLSHEFLPLFTQCEHLYSCSILMFE